MMIKIAACLLTLGFFAACQSTTTAKRETLREMQARYAAADTTSSNSPDGLSPVAAGPEDVPPDQSTDPMKNPGLLPTPLLRASAMGGL